MVLSAVFASAPAASRTDGDGPRLRAVAPVAGSTGSEPTRSARDVLARTLFGGRVSLLVAGAGMVGSLLVGADHGHAGRFRRSLCPAHRRPRHRHPARFSLRAAGDRHHERGAAEHSGPDPADGARGLGGRRARRALDRAAGARQGLRQGRSRDRRLPVAHRAGSCLSLRRAEPPGSGGDADGGDDRVRGDALLSRHGRPASDPELGRHHARRQELHDVVLVAHRLSRASPSCSPR